MSNSPAPPPPDDSPAAEPEISGFVSWNSGPMNGGRTGGDVVAAAVLDLVAFAGQELGQDDAATLLPLWKRHGELSTDDAARVLEVFE